MKKFLHALFLSLPLLFTSHFSLAGNESVEGDGRSAGVAGASVTYADVWSAFHNQAGLAYVKKFTAGAFNESPFLINELSTRGIAVALPVKDLGVFGVSMSYYGYNLYNEKKVGLAYAKSFGANISAAIQLDYFGTSIAEGYGSNAAFTVEAGFRAQIIPGLFLGVHLFNPTRAKLADYDEEKIPTVLKGGLSYVFSDKVTVSVESEKDIDADNIFKAGVEYHIVKILYVRGGVSTNPTNTAFGFGLNLDSFDFDIAASYHQQLGYTPKVSLTYKMK
jgi:hypothetical protein